LKQGIRDIEFLADPTTGEIRIACSPMIAVTVIPHVFDRFIKKYPRVVLHFDEMAAASATRNFSELRDRKYDVILARGRIPAPGRLPPAEEPLEDELNIETLFDDPLVIATGAQSKWAARRGKIDLAELVDGPWIMQPPHTWNYRHLAEVFHARGLAMPRAGFVALSMPVIAHFVADGPFIIATPRSLAHFHSLKVLPVDLPVRPWPVTIVTLKNRTLSPVVERFIECAREVTKSFVGLPRKRL
jgi:DNA-binding transcriptional LysR family regulator